MRFSRCSLVLYCTSLPAPSATRATALSRLENCRRGGWRVIASQLTCNRMAVQTVGMPDCHKPHGQQQTSVDGLGGPITQRMSILVCRRGRWGAFPRGVESREITQQLGSGRWSDLAAPGTRSWARGVRYGDCLAAAMLSRQQLKRWQVPVSPLPSLLAPGALPSDLVPNGALSEPQCSQCSPACT